MINRLSEHAVVVNTKMNYSKIQKDFKVMTQDTQKLIDKYNQSVQSIKNQELAISKVQQKLEKLKEFNEFGLLREDEYAKMEQLTTQLDLMNEKLQDTKENTSILKEKIEDSMNKTSFNVFGKSINEVGNKIDKFKTKMSRLVGTAMIFSLIRNQLTSLRNGFISLLKTNDQFSSSLNQIKANLMTAFTPIYNACLPAINSLMNSLSKVTGTIAVFVANLFGTSIKDATKDAKKLSSALNKTASSAKKASGSLGSFDTLEVLPDDSGSGASTTSNNSIDYSGELTYSQKLLDFMNNIVDYVKQNKETILGMLAGILTSITLIKLGVGGFLSLGIGVAIAGIVTLVQGIINFIKDPSWENFSIILQGLTLILAGVAIAMLAVNAANPIAWIMLAIAVITALAVLIIKKWDSIKKIFSSVGEWFYNTVISPIATFFSDLWNGIANGVSTIIDWIKGNWQGLLLFIVNPVAGVFKLLYDNCEGFRNVVDNVVSAVKGFFSGLWNNMKNGALNAWNQKYFFNGSNIF